jgi:putative transposase
MYSWDHLTRSQRLDLLRSRMLAGRPAHDLPRFSTGAGCYSLTAANYQHRPIIGRTAARLSELQTAFDRVFTEAQCCVYGWCVLPNHYHLLVDVPDIVRIRYVLGQMHGSLSRAWNQAEQQVGRRVWFRVLDRRIRSTRQLLSTLNYIHNNPVHHGYVSQMEDWQWSSIHRHLATVGRAQADAEWLAYPATDCNLELWDK